MLLIKHFKDFEIHVIELKKIIRLDIMKTKVERIIKTGGLQMKEIAKNIRKEQK